MSLWSLIVKWLIALSIGNYRAAVQYCIDEYLFTGSALTTAWLVYFDLTLTIRWIVHTIFFRLNSTGLHPRGSPAHRRASQTSHGC
jgi:hypothetical protein